MLSDDFYLPIRAINCYTDPKCFEPDKTYWTDAGFDLRTPESFLISPHDSVVINTGVHVEIPAGYYGNVCSKSGLNFKYNILTTGVIDSGYTGPIHVKLYNLGPNTIHFSKGAKIAQIIFLPAPIFAIHMVDADAFKATERGSNGFGSTGE